MGLRVSVRLGLGRPERIAKGGASLPLLSLRCLPRSGLLPDQPLPAARLACIVIAASTTFGTGRPEA